MREILLEAAMTLFAKHGYEKVTIKAIAEEAGVTSGMISYYFGGKGGLYREVLRSLFLAYERRLAGFRVDGEKDCALLLKEYFATARMIYEENPDFATIICREGADPSDEFRTQLREHEERMGGDYLKHLIRHCIDSGAIRSDFPVHILARILSLNANYYRIPISLHDTLHPHEAFDVREYFDLLGELFFSGLRKNV